MVFTILVLIETLWNVKDKTTLDFGATVSVLIETLWNVKYRGQAHKDGNAEY